MAADLLQIVDAISASPTVLLDLGNESPYGAAATSIPPPPLRRTVSSSMAADGDHISSSSYANRQITLTFDLIQTSQDAWAASWQTLARLIDQDIFWLKYQPTGMTKPVFFRCFRADATDIEDIAGATAYRRPTITIPADPAAYGLPEDVTFTITDDPSSGTNRQRYTFGTVIGDLEAPLLLASTGATDFDIANTLFFSSHAFRTVTQTHLSRSLTELTSGTDVGATVAGAGANYFDANYKSCSFATTTAATRFSGNFTTALTPIPGEYRVFMRVLVAAGAVTSFTMTTSLHIVGSSGGVSGDTVDDVVTSMSRQVGVDTPYLIDLGVYPIPNGGARYSPGVGPSPISTPAPYFNITASASAAIPVRFDQLTLVPVRTNYTAAARSAFMHVPSVPIAAGNFVVYDADNDAITPVFDSTTTSPFTGLPTGPTGGGFGNLAEFAGGLPTVVPGCTNYFTVLYQVESDPTFGVGNAFTARYYPRYLYVRPATT